MQFETSLLLLILLFFIILIVVHDAMMANYKSQVLFTSSQVGDLQVDEYGVAGISGNELPLGSNSNQVLPYITLERGEQRMKMTGEFVLDVTISDIGGGIVGEGDIIKLAVIQGDAKYHPKDNLTFTLTKVTNYPVVFGEITTIRVPFTTEKEAWNRPQSIALVDKNLGITGFTTETGNSGVCVYRASYWYY